MNNRNISIAKLWLRRLALGLLVFFGLLLALGVCFHESMPEGRTGEKADALAHKIQQRVGIEAWQATRALSWSLGKHHYVWDRDRRLVQLRWDDYEALFRTDDKTGRVFENGEELNAEERDEKLARAYRWWINDLFWLFPFDTFFMPGIERKLVELETGQAALLITYTSGGTTPGDSYLWIVDETGRPTSWKMWVSIFPVGGLEVTWEDWVELQTGAWVSTHHGMGPYKGELIKNPRGTTSLRALVGDNDPFARLVTDH